MEGRDDVAEEADAVCSVRIVVLWAIQELRVVNLERSYSSATLGSY